MFGRAVDSEDFNYRVGELDAGVRSQAGVLAEMTQSSEFVMSTLNATVCFLIG